mmetsp:Transcript_38943/g.82967  ORF Transcript_38943/g.82967 Transcript_38943/m.82967 type:complete len:348 (+) Transcript_38943:558-1601(+)
MLARGDAEGGHGECLAHRTGQEKPPPPQAIHHLRAQHRGCDIGHRHQRGSQGQEAGRHAGLLKEAVGVRHQPVDATELLEGRKAPAQKDGSAKEGVAHGLNHPDLWQGHRHGHCILKLIELQLQEGLLAVVHVHGGSRSRLAVDPIEELPCLVHLAAAHEQRWRVHGADPSEENSLDERTQGRKAQEPTPVPSVQPREWPIFWAAGRRPLRQAESDRRKDPQCDEDAVHGGMDAAALPWRDLCDVEGRRDRRDAEAHAGGKTSHDQGAGAPGESAEDGPSSKVGIRDDQLRTATQRGQERPPGQESTNCSPEVDRGVHKALAPSAVYAVRLPRVAAPLKDDGHEPAA